MRPSRLLFSSLHLLVLLLAGTLQAQQGLQLSLHEARIEANCLDRLPEPSNDAASVHTDCAYAWDGSWMDYLNDTLSCDKAVLDCFSAQIVGRRSDARRGAVTYRVHVAFDRPGNCEEIEHIDVELPEGAVAEVDGTLLVEEADEEVIYVAKYFSYEVRWHRDGRQIQFVVDEGFEPGEEDYLEFTVLQSAGYEGTPMLVRIQADGHRDLYLDTQCQNPGGGSQKPVEPNYAYAWTHDYIRPGGTGCKDNPILVDRVYVANDACGRTASVTQTIVVATEKCHAVDDSSCKPSTNLTRRDVPSELVWRPETNARTLIWGPVTEDRPAVEGDIRVRGYYGVCIWRPEEGMVWRPEELGRVAPLAKREYSFVHESFGPSDSISVVWISETRTSSLVDLQTRNELGRAKVYPNPGQTYLVVKRQAKDVAAVKVYNVFGRLQHQAKIDQSGELRVETAKWQPGMYIVEIVNARGDRSQTQWLLQR